MSYQPKHLGHVNIYVRNVERSHKWYEDVLGLHTYEYRPGWAAFMSADVEQSHEVALMQIGDDAPGQHKGQVGLNHMAWMMETLDDLKEAYLRLQEKGVKIERVVDHGISLGIYFRDPDGMVLRCPTSCRAMNGRGRNTSSRRTWWHAASSRARGTKLAVDQSGRTDH
jgi:catechol 2,3-dioxygenase